MILVDCKSGPAEPPLSHFFTRLLQHLAPVCLAPPAPQCTCAREPCHCEHVTIGIDGTGGADGTDGADGTALARRSFRTHPSKQLPDLQTRFVSGLGTSPDGVSSYRDIGRGGQPRSGMTFQSVAIRPESRASAPRSPKDLPPYSRRRLRRLHPLPWFSR